MTRCEQCGAEFEPAKPWARFCSGACRVRAHRKQHTRPTSDLEDALTDALRAVRAFGGAKSVPAQRSTGKAALEALATLEPKIEVFRAGIVPPKGPPSAVLRTGFLFADDDISTPKPGSESKKTSAEALRRRIARAVKAKHSQAGIAREIGLTGGAYLSRFRKGAPISADRAEKLDAWLTRKGF